MMISPHHSNITGRYGCTTVPTFLDKYRETVNANMLFVSVDLAGYGRSVVGPEAEEDFRNLILTGYSDSILKMVSEMQGSQVDKVKEHAQRLLDNN